MDKNSFESKDLDLCLFRTPQRFIRIKYTGEIVVRACIYQLILRKTIIQFSNKEYWVLSSTKAINYHSIGCPIMGDFVESRVILLLSMREVHSTGIFGRLRTIPHANQQHPIKIKIPTPILITWKMGSPCSCGM